MNTDAILDARYHAENIAKAAVVAHYTNRLCAETAAFHIKDAHMSFASLAAALGYRIEKVAEPVTVEAEAA